MGCSFIAPNHVDGPGPSDLFIFLMECEAVNPSSWQAVRNYRATLATAMVGTGKPPESCN